MDQAGGSRKKIVLVTSTFPRREGDTDPPFVYDLARWLAGSFSVFVVCPHAPGTPATEVMAGVSVKRFRYFLSTFETLAYGGGMLNRFRQNRMYYLLVPFFLLAELAATARMLLKEKPAVINAHWILPQGLVAVLAKAVTASRAALVCTVHGGDIYGLQGPLFDALKKYVLKRCAAVNVVSRAMARAVAALGVERARIHVIPMGVDLRERFIPGHGEQDPKTLLFVGRFAEKKGLIYLIDAMPRVLARHPDANLTIVGHGPLEGTLKNRVRELRIGHAVRFGGAAANAELPAVYQRAGIVVFPSIVDSRGDTEGFGLVMVEAMGCGCAVIASDLPAIHDSIIDGQTGLLAPQKDPAALAEKIISLLDDPAACRRLASQGRAYVLERYDWSITAAKYTAVLNGFS